MQQEYSTQQPYVKELLRQGHEAEIPKDPKKMSPEEWNKWQYDLAHAWGMPKGSTILKMWLGG